MKFFTKVKTGTTTKGNSKRYVLDTRTNVYTVMVQYRNAAAHGFMQVYKGTCQATAWSRFKNA